MLSLNEQNPFFSVHSPGGLQKSLQALLWSFLEVKAESSGFNQLWFQVDCEQYYLCMHSLYTSVQIFTGYWEPSCKEYRILHLYDHAILGISVSAPSSLQGVLGGSTKLPKKDLYFLTRIWIFPRSHLLERGLVCPPQNWQLHYLLKNKYILLIQSCTTWWRATKHRKEGNSSEIW